MAGPSARLFLVILPVGGIPSNLPGISQGMGNSPKKNEQSLDSVRDAVELFSLACRDETQLRGQPYVRCHESRHKADKSPHHVPGCP